MIRLLAALALLLCAANAQAAGNDAALPAVYRSVWAAPACTDARHIILYTASFRLDAVPDTARIVPAAVMARGDDYIKTGEGTETLFLEITRDKKLQRTALKIPNGVWPETLDPGNPALNVTMWERCEKPPAWPSLPAEGLAAIALLDDIRAACGGELITSSCTDALFSAVDITRDGALDYRDIAFGWRRLHYLNAAQRPDCAFAAQFPGDSAHEGPAIAAHVIAAHDKNADGKLSRAELPSLPPEETWSGLSPLRALIPAFTTVRPIEEKCRP